MEEKDLQQAIASVIEQKYKTPQVFIAAYTANPSKVCSKVISNLKVVPINIHRIIFQMVKNLSTTQADDEVA